MTNTAVAGATELVTDYFEGRLADGDRVLFEEHLADCGHCAEYVAQMRRTIDVLGELSAEAIDPPRARGGAARGPPRRAAA
jgi:anti-sigma factor RsiW